MARHERERLRRGPIQPLRIVHDADERALPGHLRQQAQDGQADREAIRSVPAPQAERGPERVVLRLGQPLEPVEERRAQLMQPGEGEVHLRLHARRLRHPAAPGVLSQVVKQCGHACPCLAAHDQRPAVPRPDAGHQLVQRLTLAAPAAQPELRYVTGPLGRHGGGKRAHRSVTREVQGP